jgi:hypothetical protein
MIIMSFKSSAACRKAASSTMILLITLLVQRVRHERAPAALLLKSGPGGQQRRVLLPGSCSLAEYLPCHIIIPLLRLQQRPLHQQRRMPAPKMSLLEGLVKYCKFSNFFLFHYFIQLYSQL